MNQCIEYEILTKCSKIRDNYILLRDKIIILIKIRSSKVARNCEVPPICSFKERFNMGDSVDHNKSLGKL